MAETTKHGLCPQERRATEDPPQCGNTYTWHKERFKEGERDLGTSLREVSEACHRPAREAYGRDDRGSARTDAGQAGDALSTG
eukprot:scaffold1355_cov268-Pinguiococcus_pyrenoidosus.AAC.63